MNTKREEFRKLFTEFLASYPGSPDGQRHIRRYPESRQQGEANFKEAVAAAGRGEDVTDFVLLKLLPHNDTAPNRARGAWIHIAPSVIKDIKSWFEGAGWTSPGDWPKVAQAILTFVQRCVQDPSQLPAACTDFAGLPFVKGFQTGMLTPILNALRPDDFLLVNNKSRQVINYFAGTDFGLGLRDYPEANAAGIKLITDLAKELEPSGGLRMRPSDLFDMFSHWLVAVKGAPWETRYWKIAPGEDAWQWAECREQGFIAIGWEELGDVSAMKREQFDARRDELLAQHPEWKEHGIEQVWKFARIEEGDRIVANRGTTTVLGIGTVTGPYFFVPGARHGHRLPVRWDDVTPRPVDEGGWRRTLIELEREKFVAITEAAPSRAEVAAASEASALAESSNQPMGSKFARWMGPILEALRSLGGTAPASAVLQKIQDTTPVPEADLTQTLASGQTRFYNEVHWARQALAWEGLIQSPGRGTWALTETGRKTILDLEAAQTIARKRPARHLFTAETFELLAGLRATPTKDFYAAHKAEFKEQVEGPFERLFDQVRQRVRPEIRDRMETERQIHSRILKNDYGRGGAWDFYWGAFYPKGGERTKGVQLWVMINAERLEAGFSFGEHDPENEKVFRGNLRAHRDDLISVLERHFAPLGLFYGSRKQYEANVGIPPAAGLSEWFERMEDLEASLRIVCMKDGVLQLTEAELAEKIAGLFDALFPLVLVATEQNPMPAIREYLKEPPLGPDRGKRYGIQPEYPLPAFSTDTGFEIATLESWVRAILRKGQAIIYGPPGTGKTFMAERLARHLIGGGDGFSDLVQFHPAYAYEDFMQGLRPQRSPGGGLDYPLVPGRLLEFCRQAAARTGPCVLIIDEINRANLARVFGELMYLLEYRDREIPLAGGNKLQIPAQVRLIGTMNTADRSIALVDHALRRRFAFIALYPRYGILREFHQQHQTGFSTERLIDQLKRVNEAIGDPHYHLGLSFFLRQDLAEQLPDIWRMEIEPYLEEFFFDQSDQLDQFRWDKLQSEVLP